MRTSQLYLRQLTPVRSPSVVSAARPRPALGGKLLVSASSSRSGLPRFPPPRSPPVASAPHTCPCATHTTPSHTTPSHITHTAHCPPPAPSPPPSALRPPPSALSPPPTPPPTSYHPIAPPSHRPSTPSPLSHNSPGAASRTAPLLRHRPGCATLPRGRHTPHARWLDAGRPISPYASLYLPIPPYTAL